MRFGATLVTALVPCFVAVSLTPSVSWAGTATVTQCAAGGADDLTAIPERSWVEVTPCGDDGTGAGLESRWGQGSNPVVSTPQSVVFTAPEGTTFRSARISRHLEQYKFFDAERTEANSSWNSYSLGYRLTGDDGALIERCGATEFASQGVGNACRTEGEFTSLNATSIDTDRRAHQYALSIGCYLGGKCLHYHDRFALRGIKGEFVVEDGLNPVVSSVTGPAITAAELTRTSDQVTIAATDDDGLGVLGLRMTVDGQPVSEVPWRSDDAKCRDRDPGPGYAYSAGKPCPNRPPAGTWSLPDSPDGLHRIRLEVVDATGNASSALDRDVTVDRHPPKLANDPVVTGVASAGRTLVCSVGSVDGEGVSLTYQWSSSAADGSDLREVSGATGAQYTPAAGDISRKLVCRVTATDDGGSVSRTSTITSGAFAAGQLVAADDVRTGSAPTADSSAISPAATLGTSAAAAPGPSGRGSVQGPAMAAPGCPVGTLVTLEGSSRLVAKRVGSGTTIAGAVRSGAGAPAAGVVVDLVQRVRRNGVAPTTVASGISGADGRFALKAPVGPSRDLQVVTRACGASGPVVGQSVRGQVKLRAVNPRLRNGQTVRFSGQAVGGYYGKGVGLELQVLVGRKWQDVRAVRSDAKGRFKSSYRFKRTYVRYTYRFRVITRATAGWPYTASRSPVTKVRVN